MDVTEVSVIDRGRRYRVDDPFTTKRAHRLWSDGVGDADLDPAQAARRVVDKMDDVILAHLLGIGEPRHIGDRPVHPPYTDDQQAAFLKRLSGAEEKTYAWFVEVYTRGPANQKFLQDIRLTRSPPGTDDPVATIEMLSLPTTGATLPRKGSRADRPPPPSPKPAGPAKPAGPEIRGTVKHYDPIKGRGYIIPDGKGSDILIEKAVLKACGMGRLKKNDRVVVITKDQGGKPVAIDVRR